MQGDRSLRSLRGITTLRSGREIISTRAAPVLQALLNGAATDFGNESEDSGNDSLDGRCDGPGQFLAAGQRDRAGLFNKADLVFFFATNMPASYPVKASERLHSRLGRCRSNQNLEPFDPTVAQAAAMRPGFGNRQV